MTLRPPARPRTARGVRRSVTSKTSCSTRRALYPLVTGRAHLSGMLSLAPTPHERRPALLRTPVRACWSAIDFQALYDRNAVCFRRPRQRQRRRDGGHMPGGTFSVFTRVFWTWSRPSFPRKTPRGRALAPSAFKRHLSGQQATLPAKALSRCRLPAIACSLGAMRLSPPTRHHQLPILIALKG